MLEEHQVRRVGEATAQRGQQHRRHVGRARLDDEVAREPAPAPGRAPGFQLRGFVRSQAAGQRAPSGRRCRGSPAQPRPDALAAFARLGGVLHIGHRVREPLAQQGKQRPRLAGRAAVHRREHRDLRAGPVVAVVVGGRDPAGAGEQRLAQAGVQVRRRRDVGQPTVARQRCQHPRFQLGRVGHDQLPARVGADARAQHLRDLQRAAAAAGPAPGHHSADDVVRAEPAVGDPLVEPRPAVRGEQPGQLLVLQQRRDGGMIDPLQQVLPRRRHLDPGPGERLDHARRRIRVDRPPAERLADLRGQLHQHLRPLTGAHPRAEPGNQQLFVQVGAPRQAVGGHLDRGQRARRLRGEQQPQPVRVLGRGDPPVLLREHAPDRRDDRHALGQRRRPRLEQRRLRQLDGRGIRGWFLAVRPGPGRAQAPRLPVGTLVRQQQPLGEREVVAASDPQPGGHEHRVHQLHRGEHPTRPHRRLQLPGQRRETHLVQAVRRRRRRVHGEAPILLPPGDHLHEDIMTATTDKKRSTRLVRSRRRWFTVQ